MTKWVAINLTGMRIFTLGFFMQPFPTLWKIKIDDIFYLCTYILTWFYFMAGLMSKWLHWTALYPVYPTWSLEKSWKTLLRRRVKVEGRSTCHVIRVSSVCVKNIWIFARFLKLLSKSLRAAEKNKEKVEANCTGFSANFFGTQSVEMSGKQKFKCWQLLAGACFVLSWALFS